MADAAAFLNLLPQFDGIEPGTIEAWLEQAAVTVDPSVWGGDADRSQIFLAAHLMSMAGIGPERAAAALIGIKSMSSGGLSFTKEDRTKMGDYALTSFGRLFYPMFATYVGMGPLVTGTGILPADMEDRWPGVPSHAY